MICWSCERATDDGATCAYCDAILPPDQVTDCFAVLGVPAIYALDLRDTEARFRELSRRFHPDRFAKADPRARRASLQRSVQLNEAWRIVKDPVRRAEYILQRAGCGIDDKPGAPVPPALLGEILELREDLADARAAGDDARVQAMAASVRARADAALGRVADGLARVERGESDRTTLLAGAAQDLIAIRYFRRFLEEIAVHDEAIAASKEAATHA